MRIVIVKKGVSTVGGSESHARRIANELTRLGHDILLVGLRPAWRRAGLEARAWRDGGGARLALLPARLGPLGAAVDAILHTELIDARRLRALADGADVVHSFAREYAGAAERLAGELGAALVVTPLVHPGQPFGGASRGDVARYRRASAVCAMTEWERRWYVARGVRAERVHVTGVGPILDPLPEREPEPATILFVGRREAYKGYYALARAAPLVWRARPDARFLVVGQRAWHALLTDRALPALEDERWLDLGIADEGTKAGAFARCTALCMPSRHETFGQAYLEAWLARRPVIAGDIPPVREVVDGAGLLVPQRPAAIAAAVLRLLGDPATARALAAKGYERAATRYTWEAVARRVEAAYATATRRPS